VLHEKLWRWLQSQLSQPSAAGAELASGRFESTSNPVLLFAATFTVITLKTLFDNSYSSSPLVLML
jgi:hypothetical protein